MGNVGIQFALAEPGQFLRHHDPVFLRARASLDFLDKVIKTQCGVGQGTGAAAEGCLTLPLVVGGLNSGVAFQAQSEPVIQGCICCVGRPGIHWQ